MSQKNNHNYIVTSAHAGYGKTSFIIKDSARKGFNDQYYFPLSGRMTSSFLWIQYRKMAKYF